MMRRSRPLATFLAIGLMFVSLNRVDAQSPGFTDVEQRYQQLYNQRQYDAALPYAQRAATLAESDPSLSTDDRIELLNDLAELYYLRGNYVKAEELARQVLGLRQEAPPVEYDLHAIAVSEEDIAELLDLQGEAQEGAPFHQRARPFLNNPTRGPTATSAVGRRDTLIKQSIFDFYDPKFPEDHGYGRYTYVLFPTNGGGSCGRCLQLLTAFLEGTPSGPVESEEIRVAVNVFEVPVTAGHREVVHNAVAAAPLPMSVASPPSEATSSAPSSASGKAANVLAQYDFASANELVTQACASYRQATGRFCGTLARGPYLVTYPRPISADKHLPAPYLIVDMSNVNPRAFQFFIERVKQQVGVQDLRDESRINDTFTRIVSLVLDAADVVDPTARAVSLWVKLVK